MAPPWIMPGVLDSQDWWLGQGIRGCTFGPHPPNDRKVNWVPRQGGIGAFLVLCPFGLWVAGVTPTSDLFLHALCHPVA